MNEERNQINGEKVFATLCQELDSRGWKYYRDDEAHKVDFSINGEDFPVDMIISVDIERSVVFVFSKLGFKIPEDKFIDVAIGSSFVNNRLVNGSFDVDAQSKGMAFRLANPFRGSDVTCELLSSIIDCTYFTVDKFNEKFLMLSQGIISLEQFINIVS